METPYIEIEEPIHEWFELSYASYFVVPRTVLQSMPSDWQKKFVDLVNEMNDTIDWMQEDANYTVILRDNKGRYLKDENMDYQRGRRRLPLKRKQE